MARSIFNLAVQDDEGDKLAGATVTFTARDGSPLGQSVYDVETGGAPVLVHETDSQGMLTRYIPNPDRVLYTVNGGTPRVAQFDPDPALVLLTTNPALVLRTDPDVLLKTDPDLVLRTDPDVLLDGNTNLIYRNAAAALDGYAGVAAHVLTVKATSGGGTGNKAFRVQDAAGASVLAVEALGGGGTNQALVATYHNSDVGPLIVTNFRNWDTNSDLFIVTHRVGLGEVGSHHPLQVTYVAASQPSDGFGGSTNIPDEVCANFDFFCVNTAANVAPGIGQTYDGSARAVEIQTMVFANTGVTRTMGAMSAGIHTAVPKVSNVDVALGAGGPVDNFLGDVGIYVHTGVQPYVGFGTTVRANTGFAVWGSPGFKQGFLYLNTDNSLLWTIDQFGDSYSGDLYPRPGGSFTVGSAARVWTEGHISTLKAANGSAANPTITVLGGGGNADGLFGDAAGGVLGLAASSVEKARVDASGMRFLAGVRFASPSVISPSQLVADQNNYAPTGLGTAHVVRLSSDAARNITGIAAQNGGTVLVLQNHGSFAITLKYESASSTAANRITASGADTVIPSLGSTSLIYDAATSRWAKYG